MSLHKILAINPGSTSTKIAVFEGETRLFSKNVTHDAGRLKEFREISDQFVFRKEAILKELAEAGMTLDTMDAFVGRGGGTASVEGGVYTINEAMLKDTRSGKYVKHPACLGSQLAKEFADHYNRPSYVVNPPDTDEFQDLARVTGLKGVYRESKIHALNQKEIGNPLRARKGKAVRGDESDYLPYWRRCVRDCPQKGANGRFQRYRPWRRPDGPHPLWPASGEKCD